MESVAFDFVLHRPTQEQGRDPTLATTKYGTQVEDIKSKEFGRVFRSAPLGSQQGGSDEIEASENRFRTS